MFRSHSGYPAPLRPNCRDSSTNTKAGSTRIINNLIHTGKKYKKLLQKIVLLVMRCGEPKKISDFPQALSTNSRTSSKLLATKMKNSRKRLKSPSGTRPNVLTMKRKSFFYPQKSKDSETAPTMLNHKTKAPRRSLWSMKPSNFSFIKIRKDFL